MSHPTIGPNATRQGAIALYNRLFDLAWCDRDRGITIDHIDTIPDTRYPAGVFHWEGRQYIVSVQPMPGATVTATNDWPEDPGIALDRQRKTATAVDDLPL